MYSIKRRSVMWLWRIFKFEMLQKHFYLRVYFPEIRDDEVASLFLNQTQGKSGLFFRSAPRAEEGHSVMLSEDLAVNGAWVSFDSVLKEFYNRFQFEVWWVDRQQFTVWGLYAENKKSMERALCLKPKKLHFRYCWWNHSWNGQSMYDLAPVAKGHWS